MFLRLTLSFLFSFIVLTSNSDASLNYNSNLSVSYQQDKPVPSHYTPPCQAWKFIEHADLGNGEMLVMWECCSPFGNCGYTFTKEKKIISP